jgi:plasmid stabilization system protein ParE
MKYELLIRPLADADVDGIALFIAQDNLEAALRFYEAVDVTYCPILPDSRASKSMASLRTGSSAIGRFTQSLNSEISKLSHLLLG